jgi:hypothetical protein
VLLASPFAPPTARLPNSTLRCAGWLRKSERSSAATRRHVLVSASPACGTRAPLLYASSRQLPPVPTGPALERVSYFDGAARRTEGQERRSRHSTVTRMACTLGELVELCARHLHDSRGRGHDLDRLELTARPERFELPTFGSVDRRSIQLSYGRPRASLSRCELCATILLIIFILVVGRSLWLVRATPQGLRTPRGPRTPAPWYGASNFDEERRSRAFERAKRDWHRPCISRLVTLLRHFA